MWIKIKAENAWPANHANGANAECIPMPASGVERDVPGALASLKAKKYFCH